MLTIRRHVLAVLAAIIAVLGFLPAAHAHAAGPSWVVAHSYNTHHHFAAPDNTTTERGPPASYRDTSNAYDAVDRWSRGVLACSHADGAGPTTTYATNETLALGAPATTTTGRQVEVADGDLSALPGARVAANSGNRVFWSGGDVAKNAAADYAKANGGKTLEMTLTGRALEKIPYNRFTKPVTGKLWDAASWRFARSASGDAHVFFGPNAPRPGSVFARIEGPILDSRGNAILQHFLE